jgi:release factor glutamine methyltransferase
VVATDISRAALDVARANAARLGLEIEFVEGDLLDGVTGPIDAVVSNPPYVEAGSRLAPEIARHEPAVALYGGDDGLELYRRLAPAAARASFVAFEIGGWLGEAVGDLLRDEGFETEVVKDFAGIDRVVVGRR